MLMIAPRLLVSPFAGALIDRLDRRLVMIFADAFIAIMIGILIFLFAAQIVQIWHIYVILFFRAVGDCFHRPAFTASTSLMVPKKHLSRISGLNHSVSGALDIFTPVLGALLIEVLPMHTILAVDVVTAFVAITVLFFVKIPVPVSTKAVSSIKTKAGQLFADMKAGFLFLVGWRGIFLMALVYSFVHLFFTPAVSIMPILVTDYFEGGAIQLGWMQSATGVGLVVGGLLLSAWGGHKRRIITSMMGLTMLGLCFAVIGMTPPGAFSVAIGAMFFVGFSITFVTALRMAIWQAVLPPDYQGRVFSFMSTMMAVLDIAGLSVVGPMTDRFGPQLSFLLCGIATMLLGGVTFFIPSIMRIEDRSALVESATSTGA